MSLAHGGHLTHGKPINFSGRSSRSTLRRRGGGQPHRLRRPGAAGAGGAAAAHRGGRQRLPAHHRLRAHGAPSPTPWTRCCSWTWPTSPGWSRPACTPARSRTRTSSPRPPTRRCAGRAAASSSAAPSWPRQIDRAVFPGTQGGPLMHVIAAKAVALLEARGEDFREYQRRTLENAGELAGHSARRTAPRSSRAARTTTSCSSTSRRWASPARRPSTSSTRWASPSTRTPSPSTRCRPTRPPASASASPATTTRGFGARRDAPGRRAHRAHPAPARRPDGPGRGRRRGAGPSAPASRCRDCPSRVRLRGAAASSCWRWSPPRQRPSC